MPMAIKLGSGSDLQWGASNYKNIWIFDHVVS